MADAISILVVASTGTMSHVNDALSLIDQSIPRSVEHRTSLESGLQIAKEASGPQKIIFIDSSLVQTQKDEEYLSALKRVQDEKLASSGGGHAYWIDASWKPEDKNPPLGIPLHAKECRDLLEAFHLHGHVKVV